MMEKYYQFAGVELEVCIRKEQMYREERQMGPFRVESVQNPHRFTFETVENLPKPEGSELVSDPSFRVYQQKEGTVRFIGPVQTGWETAHIRAEHRGNQHIVHLKASQFPNGIGMKTVLSAIEAEHLVLLQDGVIFHSSYIDIGGMAVVFTAPSETGKSTQAELWKQYRGAEIINGDRSAIRMIDGEIYASGIPFSGSSHYCENRTLPLAAVVYLQQAPVTSIRQLQGAQAFRRIWEGCSVNTWDREDVQRASSLVEQVVCQVSVYLLSCTPDESAVLALERMLKE
ncbi:MAG: hypothetical protein J6B95_00855 [Oscillospiraceae bacterium]|nr:hypothetical protein [Oscillospiraceae bacterium]